MAGCRCQKNPEITHIQGRPEDVFSDVDTVRVLLASVLMNLKDKDEELTDMHELMIEHVKKSVTS